jgi:hypothetical protein
MRTNPPPSERRFKLIDGVTPMSSTGARHHITDADGASIRVSGYRRGASTRQA